MKLILEVHLVCSEFGELVDRLVLDNHMLFSRTLSIQMSKCGFRSDDILFKEALFYKLVQVLLEGPAVDGLVSLAFVVGAVFFGLGERRIVLEWSQAPDPSLIFDSAEDFVDRELHRGAAFRRFFASERTRGEDREHLLLLSGLPPMSVLSMVGSFARKLRLFSIIIHRPILRSSWRKPSSPLQVGCKTELGKGPRSCWRRCASRGVCIRGEQLAAR